VEEARALSAKQDSRRLTDPDVSAALYRCDAPTVLIRR
jgi:hypothetical protein